MKKKGFTLVELIIVISILAVLALIIVPSIIGYTAKAKKVVAINNAKSCYSQLVAKVESEEAFDSSTPLTLVISNDCKALMKTVDGGKEYLIGSQWKRSDNEYFAYYALDGQVYQHTALQGSIDVNGTISGSVVQ